jgi:VanZ family protein
MKISNDTINSKLLLLFWKPVLWLALICYALFIPAKELPVKPLFKIPHFDKMVHFGLFFILCFLLLRPFKRVKLKYYLMATLISIVFSGLLEFSQQIFSKSRSSDIYDFMANTLGILFAVLFYYFFVSDKKWEKLF